MGFLDRFTHYEATMDGGGEAAPPPALDEPVAPPAAEPWAPSRQEWEEQQQLHRIVLEALAAPDEPEYVEPETPQFRTPEELMEYVQAQVNAGAERLYEERMGPYVPVLDKMAADEGKALVDAELDKIANGDPARGVTGIGEFDKGYANVLAQAYFNQGVQPHEAILRAAQETKALQDRTRAEGAQAERGQMQNRLEHGVQPAPGSAVSVQENYPQGAPPGMDKYELAAWNWNQRNASRGSPVG